MLALGFVRVSGTLPQAAASTFAFHQFPQMPFGLDLVWFGARQEQMSAQRNNVATL